MVDHNREKDRRDWQDNDRDYGKRDSNDRPGRTENTLPDRDSPPSKK
ncbi:hypothetical protein [Sphingomonas sp. VDB2]